jgi:DNA-binding NarL/FixJ family response regulator
MLEALIQQQPPRCLLIDLSVAGAGLSDFMQRLREAGSPLPHVVAYGSHVDAATLRAAREAGCDPVLPRSKFVEELPRALAEWMV